MRLVLIGLFLMFISSLSCKVKKPKPYSFFVAGHVYGSSLRKAPGLHPPFVKEFKVLRQYKDMQFGVFAGDIVYYSRDSFWDAVDRELEFLDLKVHFAVGNHDEGHKSPYKDRYGDTYYAFEQEGDLCIVLNPGLGGWNIWKEQMVFLKKHLNRAHRYHNIFLFFHQVLWWSPDNTYKKLRPNSLDGRTPATNFWPEVMPLLQKTRKPVYCFAGDVGANNQSTIFFADWTDNVRFIATGMGNLNKDNYVTVTVDAEKKVHIYIRWIQEKQFEPVDWSKKP